MVPGEYNLQVVLSSQNLPVASHWINAILSQRLKALVPVITLFQTAFWNKFMWLHMLFPRPKSFLLATVEIDIS